MLFIALPQRLLMVSLRNVLSLIRFVSLDQITKIKICHMAASEYPEGIEGRRRLIYMDVLEYEGAAEDGSIDNYSYASDKEDTRGLGKVCVSTGVSTGVNESGTEEVEEVQQAVKYYSILSYMFKPTSLLTQVFNKNNKEQDNFFSHMCNFGAWLERRNWRTAISSYLEVDTINDQYHLVNPTPLDLITGYIMEDPIGDRSL